jgi:biotin operon repressor
MAKSKRSKAKRVKAKPAAVAGTKPASKVQRVLNLCSTGAGCSLDEIMQELSVSRAAASSLIGDLRRKGKAVKFENGTYKL